MKSIIAATAVVLLAGSTAFAQVGYVTMMPVPPAPVAAYYPYVAPPIVGPVVQYAPRYYVASPVIASPYVVAAPPVVYGPRVIVHPKVYVVGQPVRNVLRAVTP